MAIASSVRQHMENSSWIRRMFELGIALKRERGEENVFDLSLGNPVVEPPSEFFDALRNLADTPMPGAHRYMPNAGYPETRQAVADTLVEETGLPYSAQHVLMTCGAAAALNVAIRAVLRPRRRGRHPEALLRGVPLLRVQPRRDARRRRLRRGLHTGPPRTRTQAHRALQGRHPQLAEQSLRRHLPADVHRRSRSAAPAQERGARHCHLPRQ